MSERQKRWAAFVGVTVWGVLAGALVNQSWSVFDWTWNVPAFNPPHTPSPTVIEEDRALIEALSRPMVRTALEAKALDYIRDGRGDDSEAVQLAASHRELGERRAEAAAVGQAAQITALTEALGRIKCGDVPRPVAKQYLPDKPSKHDRCAHGAWMYEDCGECVSDFIRTVLASKDADQ